MAPFKPRDHLVKLGEVQYDPVEYHGLLTPSGDCLIAADPFDVVRIWHTQAGTWRLMTLRRIATRLKNNGHSIGRRSVTHTCGNSHCLAQDHLELVIVRGIEPVKAGGRGYARTASHPTITRDDINPYFIHERQQSFDEFETWW